MKLERVADLRIGDVVRKGDHAFVVSQVVDGKATVTRSHVIEHADGWEIVWRARPVGEYEAMAARIRELMIGTLARAYLAEHDDTQSQLIDDLSMLVVRLARLNKDHEVSKQALDFLNRKGIKRSVLRRITARGAAGDE